jgi:hypothetical protein
MKLAILGSSPIALEAALRFHLHGASLTWFNAHETDYEVSFENILSGTAYTSVAGLEMLNQAGVPYKPQSVFSFSEWKENYYGPLEKLLGQEHRIKGHEVVSITKRYLAPEEIPENKSRFLDLFRLVYQVNPQDFIKEQEASNPETFERLSKELVDSLQKHIEMYEDFDLVLDLRKATSCPSISVSGRALGEGRVSSEHVFYGLETLNILKELKADAHEIREIALIGSDALSAKIITSLKEWLKDDRSRLFVVSEEASPYEKFLDAGENSAVNELKIVLNDMENEFQQEITTFHQKLREWQSLDDFVQAKISRPVEPIPRLVFFSGHNATAIDQLIDKRRLFLTLEKPDFRKGVRQPENNLLELKTIGVDRVLVANKMRKSKLEIHLNQEEKGFFTMDSALPNIKNAWEKDLDQLKGIENEIFKLFSPADNY